METILLLCKSFALVGLGAYGGGLVTIPLIQHEIVVKQSWLLFEEMASLLAIAQMTPGPIAINSATFVGYRISGYSGAALATLSVIIPSILLLMLVAPFIDKISKNDQVKKARRGIQIGVLSLIIYATWSYGSIAIGSGLDFFIALISLSLLVYYEGKLHPVCVILAGGLLGLVIF